MALWRFGRGWSDSAMKQYLAELRDRSISFTEAPENMTVENGWTVDGAEKVIGREAPGPPEPDGVFARAKQGIINYDFSDPAIVEGHFDPEHPFVGRDILLEIKCLGLRFLNGARVFGVRDEVGDAGTVFGFRYDTLEGHIEQGYEWFLLTKDHASGEVRFKIEAHWRLGDFPNWWSAIGFKLIGERYREMWRHRAPERLRKLAHQPPRAPLPPPGELAHRGDPSPRRTDPAVGQSRRSTS